MKVSKFRNPSLLRISRANLDYFQLSNCYISVRSPGLKIQTLRRKRRIQNQTSNIAMQFLNIHGNAPVLHSPLFIFLVRTMAKV